MKRRVGNGLPASSARRANVFLWVYCVLGGQSEPGTVLPKSGNVTILVRRLPTYHTLRVGRAGSINAGHHLALH